MSDEIARLKAELAAANSQLQCLAHDLTMEKARARNLLAERVQPFLHDAVDAIEINEPAIALRRIRSVLTAVKTYN